MFLTRNEFANGKFMIFVKKSFHILQTNHHIKNRLSKMTQKKDF